jgi:hypothetical protein
MDIGKTGLGKWEKDQVDFARRERVRLTDEAAERARLSSRADGRRDLAARRWRQAATSVIGLRLTSSAGIGAGSPCFSRHLGPGPRI